MTYPTPKIEFLTETPQLSADREQTVNLLIRITAPDLQTNKLVRPPLNLSLVIDRSGSMAGEKMARAREAAAYCIDQLLPQDRISVVTFDDEINVLIPSQPVVNKAELKRHIASIQSRGSTALHEAWVRGGMQVSERLQTGAINRVLLITDGQANVGETNTDTIVTQALGLFRRGVSTSTIGIGADFNEDLLLPMAQSAGGNAWHVEEAADLPRIFAVELEGLVAQFAHTVSLGVVPSDGIRIVDALNNFELTDTGRYKLPNLQAGSPVEVVLQLRVPAQATGKRLRLLDLRLGYTPQSGESRQVVKQSFEIVFAAEAVVSQLPVNAEVVTAVQLLMNARARQEAIRHIDAGDRLQAQQILLRAAASTRVACAPMLSSPVVQEEIDQLSQLQSDIMSEEEAGMNRKKLVYGDYSRRHGKKQK